MGLRYIFAAFVAFSLLAPAPSSAGKKRARKVKVCKTKENGKRSCRYVKKFSGSGVHHTQLRQETLPIPSGELRLVLPNFREEFHVNIFDVDGQLDEGALSVLDHAFRCKRSHEERAMDPKLYHLLAIVYDHFGQKPIEIVSGFRFTERSGSRHHHASAIDFRIKGVSTKKLRDFVYTLDQGRMGVGYYPRSNFVHMDIRAPGSKSHRWTDYSGPGSKSGRKRKRRPNS